MFQHTGPKSSLAIGLIGDILCHRRTSLFGHVTHVGLCRQTMHCDWWWTLSYLWWSEVTKGRGAAHQSHFPRPLCLHLVYWCTGEYHTLLHFHDMTSTRRCGKSSPYLISKFHSSSLIHVSQWLLLHLAFEKLFYLTLLAVITTLVTCLQFTELAFVFKIHLILCLQQDDDDDADMVTLLLHSAVHGWMLRVYRSRARDQDEAIAKLKRQLTEAEAKIQQQARDFDTYKNQLHTKPEVQLQSDVNLLTIEKVSSISLAHKCSVWYWIVYFPKLKCECSNYQNLTADLCIFQRSWNGVCY